MDDEFEKLKKQGKNTVDGLVQWLKDSKICDGTKETEERVRKLFADVADASNVELSKFKEALAKLAQEQHKNVEELAKTLAAEAPKLLNAFAAGASAFKEALKGKK
ncbi:uncharacterized protein [Epargyreus clarus]|uniref:uncharacterized protein n=1 Tax=Epargyreus clarus TaxID=520877 RepID=UPI003C2EC6D7